MRRGIMSVQEVAKQLGINLRTLEALRASVFKRIEHTSDVKEEITDMAFVVISTEDAKPKIEGSKSRISGLKGHLVGTETTIDDFVELRNRDAELQGQRNEDCTA